MDVGLIIAYNVWENPVIGPAPLYTVWLAALAVATVGAVAERDLANANKITWTKAEDFTLQVIYVKIQGVAVDLATMV